MSCIDSEDATEEWSFGGFFQTSSCSLNGTFYLLLLLLEGFTNPYTSSFSCPEGFKDSIFASFLISENCLGELYFCFEKKTSICDEACGMQKYYENLLTTTEN
jgi:hypothetical protein